MKTILVENTTQVEHFMKDLNEYKLQISPSYKHYDVA
jgi:hypothetical protein